MIALAVAGVAAIAFATLCPIGMRPHLAGANQERFSAYLVLGGLVGLAAPRRWLAATLLVVALAFGLEAAQHLTSTRHAVLSDAIVKALGGAFGAASVQFGFSLRRLVRARGWRSLWAPSAGSSVGSLASARSDRPERR
jgi:hypothetical protein